jgi:hypothetical protein
MFRSVSNGRKFKFCVQRSLTLPSLCPNKNLFTKKKSRKLFCCDKMASLTGRIILAAARRNATYTPVRFCKSKLVESIGNRRNRFSRKNCITGRKAVEKRMVSYRKCFHSLLDGQLSDLTISFDCNFSPRRRKRRSENPRLTFFAPLGSLAVFIDFR